MNNQAPSDRNATAQPSTSANSQKTTTKQKSMDDNGQAAHIPQAIVSWLPPSRVRSSLCHFIAIFCKHFRTIECVIFLLYVCFMHLLNSFLLIPFVLFPLSVWSNVQMYRMWLFLWHLHRRQWLHIAQTKGHRSIAVDRNLCYLLERLCSMRMHRTRHRTESCSNSAHRRNITIMWVYLRK